MRKILRNSDAEQPRRGYRAVYMALVLALSLQLMVVGTSFARQGADSDGWIPLFGENWDQDWSESRFYRNSPRTGKKIYSLTQMALSQREENFICRHICIM